MRVINGLEELEALAGAELGASGWLQVTQDMVNRFADVTRDHQWIHTDVQRATEHSPFGGTVAHGFLTLSLIPHLTRQIADVTGVSTRINYGLERVRFPHPVRVGSNVRAVQRVLSTKRIDAKSLRLVSRVVVEIEGADKPACVAETVTLVYG